MLSKRFEGLPCGQLGLPWRCSGKERMWIYGTYHSPCLNLLWCSLRQQGKGTTMAFQALSYCGMLNSVPRVPSLLVSRTQALTTLWVEKRFRDPGAEQTLTTCSIYRAETLHSVTLLGTQTVCFTMEFRGEGPSVEERQFLDIRILYLSRPCQCPQEVRGMLALGPEEGGTRLKAVPPSCTEQAEMVRGQGCLISPSRTWLEGPHALLAAGALEGSM